MAGADNGGYLNSKWFLIAIFGGYMFLILGMVSNEKGYIWGMVGSFGGSVMMYFYDYIASINTLSGTVTIDSISYVAGERPGLMKIHVCHIDPIPLDLDQLDVENLPVFIDKKNKELEKLESQILGKKATWNAVNDLLGEKMHNVQEEIKREYEFYAKNPDKVKGLYAYRCVLINQIVFDDDSKIKFNQVVLITKRPFSVEFFTHQDSTKFKGIILNTALSYACLIRWNMATLDIPVFYSRFTDADGYEEAKQQTKTETISSIHVRVVDQIMASQRAKYMGIDKILENAKYTEKDLISKNQSLEQLVKMYSSNPLRSKSDFFAGRGKISMSRGSFACLIITFCILIGMMMYSFGKAGMI